jgi:colanic acid biosynthesis glycosyl transferase WcaI
MILLGARIFMEDYRILVNDYAGHPFQIELSRWLAKQGYQVLHVFCDSVQTPRGLLKKTKIDSETLDIQAISLQKNFNKYGYISRWNQEIELGKKLVNKANDFIPDIIISANTPLRAQKELLKYAKKNNCEFIFWLQDILSFGIRKALTKKIYWAGVIIGSYFEKLEKNLWANSSHIVTITEDFSKVVVNSGVEFNRITTIENWAPLNELSLEKKNNDWSRRHRLSANFCVLYTGTLGLKHNPKLLVELALAVRSRTDVNIVITSEGLGAEYIKRESLKYSLENIIVLDFQPFEEMSKILATGDILVTLLEPDAGLYAVPSKVLTYLCAGKPLVLAVPKENLSARIVLNSKSGIVVSPLNSKDFIDSVVTLLDNKKMSNEMGRNAINYAQNNFDINKIGKQFEEIIFKILKK